MPKYRITDPKTGRTLTVMGDSPPTEQELETLFGHVEAIATPPQSGSWRVVDAALDIAKDVGIGALKGAGSRIFGLGKMVRDYTPIGYVSDAIQPGAFAQRPPQLTPTTPAQKVGFATEQIGEYFVPVGAGTRAVKAAAEIGKAALLTKAQGGTGGEAAASGAITAAMPPVARGLTRLAAPIRRSAEKTVAQALGATKEWAKSEAAKLAPQMLQRGVRGSLPKMQDLARASTDRLGQEINAAVQAASQQGVTLPAGVVSQALQSARASFTMVDPQGKTVIIPGTQRLVAKLDKMDAFVQRLGPDIPFDQAHRIRQVWDQIVSKAGLYGQKATASATDQADAWALREGASRFRELLAQGSPDLAKLNKEFEFWAGLRNVIRETQKRQQSQTYGLFPTIMGAGGASAGLASGETWSEKATNAIVYGAAGRGLVRAMQSPWWRTTIAAPFKYNLARALSSGVPSRITEAVNRLIAASVGRTDAAIPAPVQSP